MAIARRKLAIPKLIPDSRFEEICRDSKITGPQRAVLQSQVNDLVKVIAASMKDQRRAPDRKTDRKNLDRALSHIRRAGPCLRLQGKSGRWVLGVMASYIGPMVSVHWLRDQFPGANPRPQTLADLFGDVEDALSIEQRSQFVRSRPVEVLQAVLCEIEHTLAFGQWLLKFGPGSKGGPKQLVERQFLLMMLAEIWTRLDRPVSSSPNSAFMRFSADIIGSIGWPTRGIEDAIVDAVERWKELKNGTG